MSTQQVCQNVDFNEILNCARTEVYSLTTEQRESLGAFLTSEHSMVVLDTELKTLYMWDGSQWVAVTNTINTTHGIFTGVTNDVGELVIPHTLGTTNFVLSVLQENSWYPISVVAKTAVDFKLVVYDTTFAFPQLFTPITLNWTATIITI